jgi:AcrR family transcriptional regulator
MSKRNITQQAIVQTFKGMVEEKSFNKITVTDLCEKTGISRRCFYDYFKDTHDIVIWIFNEEFLSAYTLDNQFYFFGDFFYNLCDYCYQNAPYYGRILTLKGQNSFRDYFKNAIRPIVYQDVKKGIEDDLLAEMFINSIVDLILFFIPRWLNTSPLLQTGEFVEKTLDLYASAAYTFGDYVKESAYFKNKI